MVIKARYNEYDKIRDVRHKYETGYKISRVNFDI